MWEQAEYRSPFSLCPGSQSSAQTAGVRPSRDLPSPSSQATCCSGCSQVACLMSLAESKRHYGEYPEEIQRSFNLFSLLVTLRQPGFCPGALSAPCVLLQGTDREDVQQKSKDCVPTNCYTLARDVRSGPYTEDSLQGSAGGRLAPLPGGTLKCHSSLSACIAVLCFWCWQGTAHVDRIRGNTLQLC